MSKDQRMGTDDAAMNSRAGVLGAVAGAREEALNALECLSDDRVVAAGAPGAMVALQAAANELGVAERALETDARPVSDVPPAILAPDDPAATMSTWTGEALAVMALAELSVPYAPAPADEVDDWLRALRRE